MLVRHLRASALTFGLCHSKDRAECLAGAHSLSVSSEWEDRSEEENWGLQEPYPGILWALVPVASHSVLVPCRVTFLRNISTSFRGTFG